MAAPRRTELAIMLAACLVAWTAASGTAAAGRLDAIKARGFLTCGIHAGVAGFATRNEAGDYAGFDIDFCRAIAAAILGAPDKARFVEATGVDAFRAAPDIDLVIRRLTQTLTREAGQGLLFGPITFYDGQGFLVRKASGIAAVADLRGKSVCVEPGEGEDLALLRYSGVHGLGLRPAVIADHAAAGQAFFAGRCDAYSADVTMLAAVRSAAHDPGTYDILPLEISKEPLAPLLRQGDDQFFEIVRWAAYALIAAEELGITAANADGMMKSRDPAIRRLLGAAPGNGMALGLDEGWARSMIRSVGNYGEIYDRNLGPATAIRLPRGLNRLWTQGGLLYAPPLR